MGFSFEAPLALLLLVPALALTIALYLSARRRLGAGRRRLALIVRTALLLALVFALAGFRIVLPVDRLATVLKEDAARKVLIEGHTDSVGSDEYNQSLSERRAQSVQAALFERGVEASQISTVGKGETSPVASNDSPVGRQQNRRVELVFQDDRSRVASDTD